MLSTGTLFSWFEQFQVLHNVQPEDGATVCHDLIAINLRKINLEDISPFCGATDTPVLDFWWCLLWVPKPLWAALFALGKGVCVTCSLRFTSGATPADMLAAELFSSTYLQVGIGRLETRTYLPQANALPTELCRLVWSQSVCNLYILTNLRFAKHVTSRRFTFCR